MAKKNMDQLSATVRDGKLEITIGIGLLAHSIENGSNSGNEIKVTNREKFAASLASALLNELEDGTTPIHEAFDAATEWMCEQGIGDGYKLIEA